jgi:GH25 family lysozyme M1 (1,4-beta-N-acetylmuramidase)
VGVRMIGLQGIDVSEWQSHNGEPIDWDAIYDAGARFTYIRVCRGVWRDDGESAVDKKTAENIIGATDAGLLVGLYQRLFPNLGTAEEHALFWLACTNRLGDIAPAATLAPTADYEEKIRGGNTYCMQYMDRVRDVTGRDDYVLYSSGSWFNPGSWIGQDGGWVDDPGISLWVADTGKFTDATPGHPEFQHPKIRIHQYAQKVTVPGLVALGNKDIATGLLPLGR